ncbi:MAG: prolyl oligopeptidase family serine peptidase [Candidatus Aminicenantes bacterium]|nr:prolyl oligopeptidase family serine peptidase [Candidatus Aminicenantes bacterium]
MKHQTKFILFLLMTALFVSCQNHASPTITKKDYQRAESFLPQNLRKIAYNMRVSPHWIHETSSFWYKAHTREGKKFWKVNPAQKQKLPAFDHQKLAEALSEQTEKDIASTELPFDHIEFVDSKTMEFKFNDQIWSADLTDYRLMKKHEKEEEDKQERLSPDKKWEAFIKDHNLFIRSTQTQKEIQLSTKGTPKHEYASRLGWGDLMEGENGKREGQIFLKWSPDSTKIYTHILDLRKAKKLFLLKSADEDSFRAQHLSYYRALPGETETAFFMPIIFDIDSRKEIQVRVDPIPQFLGMDVHWFQNSQKLYARKFDRGYKAVNLYEINAQTGDMEAKIRDENRTYIEPYLFHYKVLPESKTALITSETSGWNHIYLYNWEEGTLIRQITEGEFVVLDLVFVDQKNNTIVFKAVGKEKNRDPYLVHLYSIKMDGSELKLLTPEHADHEIHVSPDHLYIVDNYSTVLSSPQSVLRALDDGSILMELEKADISDIASMGWEPPEPFQTKAADGKTDIFGLIWKPTHFDPSLKYPVIDQTYTGPQAVNTPKAFSRALFHSNTPLAELGFIAVTIDGRGTARRSKMFHDFSYQNLGRGCTDHITALKHIARDRPYMDLEKIGIYGHSAGGYDAAHALLKWPDFYKVAVSSSGNHDHRMAKAWWPELYMGYPVDTYYEDQSNITLAGNLQGKLLLVHGDLDENVNPASTIRLAHALIKNKRDFDLLILPNNHHGYHGVFRDYFIQKRWDYFVEHLLGIDPPEYSISSSQEEE